VVVAEEWEELARRQLAHEPAIEIIAQPSNLGTGPGVLLPLARVRARAPSSAQVVVTPSDHHYTKPVALSDALKRADSASRSHPRDMVLLGAIPDRPCSDLGWIVSDAPTQGPDGVRQVTKFIEKPPAEGAERLRRQGALWNTFVMLGSIEALWSQAEKHLPSQTKSFERYVAAIGNSTEPKLLRDLYKKMEAANFSQDVLERMTDLLVVPVADSGWCDWGTPESLFESLKYTTHLKALQRRMVARSAADEPRSDVLVA
jgi:mannose-1-phosphate guanylyltransferase